MAIQHHPLAAKELGEFQKHHVINLAAKNEPANWCAFFCYEHGIVKQESISNSRVYKYDTKLDNKNDPVGLSLSDGKMYYLSEVEGSEINDSGDITFN